MRIRPVELEDAPAVAELLGQLGYPTSDAEARARLAELRATGSEHCVLVAVEPDDRVVGWIQVSAVLSLETGPFGEIRGLVVLESERGRGVGVELVAAGEGWVRARGLDVVRVRSNVVRERTHRFYERLGYEGLKSQRVFLRRL